jgi:hypothetical protein
MSGTDDLPLVISWFPTAMPAGPAIGDPERTTWGAFCGVFRFRREGGKDGPCFVPARFTLEPDKRHVRRLAGNLIARTAVALDVETNKATGEIPPDGGQVMERIKATGKAALSYTSHNHTAAAPRYRIVLPLSQEIDADLPAAEVIADRLQLTGVIDRSKLSAAVAFYLPSAAYGSLGIHDMVAIGGDPIDAVWMRQEAGALLAERQAEQDRIAAVAHAEAAARREAKIAAGFNPDDSLIEKLRPRFDLDEVLRSHGYATAGSARGRKYRHPNSASGLFGADIRTFAGIERVFSHNATDPLHPSNLPAWCRVTALDALDVVIILDFGGDRTRALRELAERFGTNKTDERRELAKLIFRLIHQQAPQEAIEASAYAEGVRLGLSRAEVVEVATWCANEEQEA